MSNAKRKANELDYTEIRNIQARIEVDDLQRVEINLDLQTIQDMIEVYLANPNKDLNEIINDNRQTLIHLAVLIAADDEKGSLELLLRDERCDKNK